MPYVMTKTMLRKARQEGYAVGAFNVENMEMVQAVIQAAEKAEAPVILQTTPSTLGYGTTRLFAGMVRALAEESAVPVALHLDHGNSFDLAMRALRDGYTSVMFDGSQYALEENIRRTKEVVSAAGPMGVPVEAELGRIGGKEDSLASKGSDLTDPDAAAAFVEATGVDSLAVAIGTAHGFYSTPPVLNIGQLSKIRQKVEIPLVLHGGTGLSDQAIRECVREGIAKVNFATELRKAYTDGVRKVLSEDPDIYDPKKYGKKARETVTEQVLARMAICGCCQRI